MTPTRRKRRSQWRRRRPRMRPAATLPTAQTAPRHYLRSLSSMCGAVCVWWARTSDCGSTTSSCAEGGSGRRRQQRWRTTNRAMPTREQATCRDRHRHQVHSRVRVASSRRFRCVGAVGRRLPSIALCAAAGRHRSDDTQRHASVPVESATALVPLPLSARAGRALSPAAGEWAHHTRQRAFADSPNDWRQRRASEGPMETDEGHAGRKKHRLK